MLLPLAFRSLSRPSSPRSSKASTIHLYSLDHIIVYSLIETLPLTVASASVRFATSRFFGQARRAGISFPRSVVSFRSRFISTLNVRSLATFMAPRVRLVSLPSSCQISLAFRQVKRFAHPCVLSFSTGPIIELVGLGLIRVELMTPSLSEKCSNQLSYRPV